MRTSRRSQATPRRGSRSRTARRQVPVRLRVVHRAGGRTPPGTRTSRRSVTSARRRGAPAPPTAADPWLRPEHETPDPARTSRPAPDRSQVERAHPGSTSRPRQHSSSVGQACRHGSYRRRAQTPTGCLACLPDLRDVVLRCVTMMGERGPRLVAGIWRAPHPRRARRDHVRTAGAHRRHRARQPNRAYAVTIAFVVAEAIDRTGGSA